MYSLTFKKILIPDLDIHHEDGRRLFYVLSSSRPKAKCWEKNRKYHRKNKPAIEYTNGDKEWWLDGKRHRSPVEGPAVMFKEDYYFYSDSQFKVAKYENGTRELYRYNTHRKKFELQSLNNIPAISYSNGDIEHWDYGKNINQMVLLSYMVTNNTGLKMGILSNVLINLQRI
ncbi:MAG: hypothetical protein EKK64_06575 [Neisseriaceae bacterium]|nr:MAG: hypothetical protein EKK64_06575 [Neisseriaceae bacterium]